MNSETKISKNKQNMIIYSVTTQVDEQIHEEWLSWVEGHIAHVLESGKFTKASFFKVLDAEPNTYTIQFTAESLEKITSYQKEDAPTLKEGTLKKFPKGLTNSRTQLEFIKEFEYNK